MKTCTARHRLDGRDQGVQSVDPLLLFYIWFITHHEQLETQTFSRLRIKETTLQSKQPESKMHPLLKSDHPDWDERQPYL
jgi:hypothetical protein